MIRDLVALGYHQQDGPAWVVTAKGRSNQRARERTLVTHLVHYHPDQFYKHFR